MGAAVSGHSSCPDHRGRLACVDSNDVSGARCGVCRAAVGVGARVHRCRKPGCGFVLHDGCFRLPSKVKRHFAHPGHRLTLGAVAGGGGHYYCNLCTGKLDAHSHAYSCAATPACSAGGFRAHPRCCHLPEKMLDEKLHPHGRLVLRNDDGGRGRASRNKCLRCRKTTTAKAWSASRACSATDTTTTTTTTRGAAAATLTLDGLGSGLEPFCAGSAREWGSLVVSTFTAQGSDICTGAN